MPPPQAILTELGQRLRQARGDVGLSVSELARRSGLSRRHVAEAEAGRANLSILKLAQLASVLRVRLAWLCDLGLAPQNERVALVGLRGAGKTTVGRHLALELEVPFIELDERVEELAGLSLAEIFDLHGENAYRRFEGEALEAVLASGSRSVIAAGGSIVTSDANFLRLRGACRTVWLHAAPEDHLQRVLSQGDARPTAGRPRAMDELKTILEQREPLYGLCENQVGTSGKGARDVTREIADWLLG
ncbi:MAG: XRE family aerobic/anaerobic benzoate catabolism transcriptional regulator [Chlamydiales bacterium]|jgi:XRE family aerobic/anaerobic benzoate catabolism transcriptional regulator